LANLVVERVRVRVLPDGRLDTENAARYIGCTKAALANSRMKGKGPRSVRVGGRVFYFLEDLQDYVGKSAA
jgi:hypothetical protein